MIATLTSLQDTTVASGAVILFAIAAFTDALVLRPTDPRGIGVIRAVFLTLAAAAAVMVALVFWRSALATWLFDVLARLFANGADIGLAGLCLLWSIGIALKRILGARTIRTFLQRLLLGAQRIVATLLVAVIAVALWRGGFGFLGAPVCLGVAVLVAWTLKTNEASVDRRDRLVTVVRRYA